MKINTCDWNGIFHSIKSLSYKIPHPSLSMHFRAFRRHFRCVQPREDEPCAGRRISERRLVELWHSPGFNAISVSRCRFVLQLIKAALTGKITRPQPPSVPPWLSSLCYSAYQDMIRVAGKEMQGEKKNGNILTSNSACANGAFVS